MLRPKSLRRFSGFPDGTLVCTPVPNLFFAEALPEITSSVELQVTLQAFRLVGAKRGFPKYLTVSDFLSDAAVVSGLRSLGGLTDEALRGLLEEGLSLATERGTLLALAVEREDEGGKRSEPLWLYFANGPIGRRAINEARDGKLDLGRVVGQKERGVAQLAAQSPREERPEPGASGERPTIFSLYEQNIGLLTPMLVEELAEAEKLYPTDWLQEAFRIAVGYNRRNWRYIVRILERWAIEGKHEDKLDGRRITENRGRAGGNATSYGRARGRANR